MRLDFNVEYKIILYIPPYQLRILVSISTNPANKYLLIYSLFQKKLDQYIVSLQLKDLNPSDIWLGLKCFWWPSIKYIAPALTLNPQSNILNTFYRKLLLLLQINRNILQALLNVPFFLGEFRLQSLEIEQGIEVIGMIISIFSSNLPMSDLLKQSIEYTQLEIGIDK